MWPGIHIKLPYKGFTAEVKVLRPRAPPLQNSLGSSNSALSSTREKAVVLTEECKFSC